MLGLARHIPIHSISLYSAPRIALQRVALLRRREKKKSLKLEKKIAELEQVRKQRDETKAELRRLMEDRVCLKNKHVVG